MSAQWWVIDRRTDRVVNVLTTVNGAVPPSLAGFIDTEHLYVTTSPTTRQWWQWMNHRHRTERP